MKTNNYYHAHSKQIYGTIRETQELEFLRSRYPNANIIDPNSDIGELKNFNDYLKIVDSCNLVIASEFEGFIGKGIYSEIEHAFENHTPVLVLRKQNNEFYLQTVTTIEIYNEDDWFVKYAKLT